MAQIGLYNSPAFLTLLSGLFIIFLIVPSSAYLLYFAIPIPIVIIKYKDPHKNADDWIFIRKASFALIFLRILCLSSFTQLCGQSYKHFTTLES